MNGPEPSNVEIVSYLEDLGKPNDASWTKPDDHLKAGEMARKGLRLVELSNTNK